MQIRNNLLKGWTRWSLRSSLGCPTVLGFITTGRHGHSETSNCVCLGLWFLKKKAAYQILWGLGRSTPTYYGPRAVLYPRDTSTFPRLRSELLVLRTEQYPPPPSKAQWPISYHHLLVPFVKRSSSVFYHPSLSSLHGFPITVNFWLR